MQQPLTCDNGGSAAVVLRAMTRLSQGGDRGFETHRGYRECGISAGQRIFAELKQQLHGRIGIMIWHRFSTVRIADRIAVVRDGHVTGLGSNKELVALGGRYAQMFDPQASDIGKRASPVEAPSRAYVHP